MLSESTLSLLQRGNLGDDIQKMNVWAQDDISPTSLMFNYKSANAILLWTPYATTRLLRNGEEAEVILHQDNTVLHLREKGNFITQYLKNSSNDDSARLRSFTSETIPFKQVAHQQEKTQFINLQVILLDAFTMMKNYIFHATTLVDGVPLRDQQITVEEQLEQTRFNVQNMSGSNVVVKEMSVNGLANFTAFANQAIKVVFEDRTIVRMQKGQEFIRVLSSKGEELTFNVHSIARNQQAQRQFQNYIQVATEFFDWVFLTTEELEGRNQQELDQTTAINGELEKIQRQLKTIGGATETNVTASRAEEKIQTESVFHVETTAQGKASNVIQNNQSQIEEIEKLLASM